MGTPGIDRGGRAPAVYQLSLLTVVDLGQALAAPATADISLDYDGTLAGGIFAKATSLITPEQIILNADGWYPSDLQGCINADVTVTLGAISTDVPCAPESPVEGHAFDVPPGSYTWSLSATGATGRVWSASGGPVELDRGEKGGKQRQAAHVADEDGASGSDRRDRLGEDALEVRGGGEVLDDRVENNEIGALAAELR